MRLGPAEFVVFMNRRRQSGHQPKGGILAIAITAAAAAGVLGLSMALAATNGKVISNPWAGLTDEQKQAQVDAAHAANDRFLQELQARNGDPRTLPVIRISPYALPASSMGVAVRQAALVVHGRVTAIHFASNPGGGMPTMSATVQTLSVGKGSIAATLTVVQAGGPVAQGTGGALVEFDDEDLMFAGDEVLLILASPPNTGGFVPIYGPGVQKIVNGTLSGRSAVRYGIDGQSYDTVWSALVDPSLPASAFPIRASAD